MKTLNRISQIGNTLANLALTVAVAVGLSAGSAEAVTTTATYTLGTQANPTTVNSGESGLLPWIAKGALPTGSILKSVAIDAIIENAGNDAQDDWAQQLCVYLDPSPQAAGTAARLQVGGYDVIGTVTRRVGWGNGDGGPRRPVTGTKTAADWSSLGDIDLNTVQLSIGNDYSQAAWSGTVTIEYEIAEPAKILSFSFPSSTTVIDQGTKTITLTAQYGTDLTDLIPTYTLTSGTCDKDNGGPTGYDFSNSATVPVDYTVTDTSTDPDTVNVYYVTVNVTPVSTACDMLSFNANLAGSNAYITTLPAATGSTVTVFVPTGTTAAQVADLTPSFTLSPFATCTQVNPGIPMPPLSTTTPVTYTVTAESGAFKEYAVSVIVDGPPPDFMALTGDAPTEAGYWNAANELDGYQFTVGASNITVSWLGWYDAKNNSEGTIGDGFKAQIKIGIWQVSDESLLAQTTLEAGVVGTAMSGSFRGSGIAPITLTAGTTYTIAGYGTGGDRIHELSSTAGFTKNGVTIDTGIYGYAWPSMPKGTYGPLIGPNFGGTGPSGGGFSAWQTANNATGQTSDQDHDNDGVENGIEYFMGQTGSSFTAMPGLDATNKVSWTMDAAYQGTYEVQTSPDLVTWTNVDPKPTPADGTLSYTLPSGAGKLFVRLLVTPTP